MLPFVGELDAAQAPAWPTALAMGRQVSKACIQNDQQRGASALSLRYER